MFFSGRGFFQKTNENTSHTLISLINVEPTLTNFEKFHPPQKKNPPSSFIDFITKVSDIIAEPDDNFSHDHFEL